jgi:putative transposase
MTPVRSTLGSFILERPEPTTEQQEGMCVVCLDAGCAYEEEREIVCAFKFTAYIRSRAEEAQARKREVGFTARRWVVERAHPWLNRLRRLLIRWDKKP